MHICRGDVESGQIVVKLLRHPFGESGDENALVFFNPFLNFIHQVVYLVERCAHFYFRVKQSGGAYDLFDHHAFRLCQFIVGGSGADVDGLGYHRLEFVETKRAVVERGRQTESVVDQIVLAGYVTSVHGPDLRYGHMAFVDDGKEILGKIVQQAERTVAR